MSDSSTQQRVIVTAGGSGIGRAIVDRFVASGALVHTCDVQPDLLEEVIASSEAVSGTLADVGKPNDVEALIAEAVAQMGASMSWSTMPGSVDRVQRWKMSPTKTGTGQFRSISMACSTASRMSHRT